MKRFSHSLLFLLIGSALFAACKGKDPDGPGGGGGQQDRFFSYGLSNDSLNNLNYTQAAPPPVVSGGIVFSAGQLGDRTQSNVIFAFRPDSQLLFMKRIRTGLYGISSLRPDGAGGVLLYGYTASNLGYAPWVGRMNASGTLLWSKSYTGNGLVITGTDQFIRGVVSEIVNGKCVLTSPATVAVLDAATGEVLWRKESDNAGDTYTEVAADVDGFTLLGGTGAELAVIRMDWNGGLQWAKASSVGKAAGWAINPVAKLPGGALLLPFLYKDAPSRTPSYGIARIEADGSVSDKWGYLLNGSYSNNGITMPQGGETMPFTLTPNEDGGFWLDVAARRYLGTAGQDRVCHAAAAISADGTVTTAAPPVFANDNTVYTGAGTMVALEDNGGMVVGATTAACRARGVDGGKLEKTTTPYPALPPLSMVSLTRTFTMKTTTVADPGLLVEDMGVLKALYNRDCPGL